MTKIVLLIGIIAYMISDYIVIDQIICGTEDKREKEIFNAIKMIAASIIFGYVLGVC